MAQAIKAPIWTPFDTPMPEGIPRKFWINTNTGRNFALYTLAPVDKEEIFDLLQTIKFHTDIDAPTLTQKVVRAPIYDFYTSKKTLRDIMTYHMNVVEEEERGIALSRFIVVAHPDWESQGVLLVDFDCSPINRGTPGILRLEVGAIPHALVLLEASNRKWTDLKATELDIRWPSQIAGYTNTRWQRNGYNYQDDSLFLSEADGSDFVVVKKRHSKEAPDVQSLIDMDGFRPPMQGKDDIR